MAKRPAHQLEKEQVIQYILQKMFTVRKQKKEFI